MMKFVFIFFLATTTALSSCGWQLRGTESSSAFKFDVKTIHISYANKSSELRPYIKALLDNKKIELTSDSPLQLFIANEQLTTRSLAMNETGVTIQYQLILQVDFGYNLSKENTVVHTQPKQTLFSRRAYDFDPTQLLAEDEEKATLLKEMRNELAIQILNRIKLPEEQQ